MAHYKEVLATTETMLTSLQSSVETAETEWKLKLEVANKCVFGVTIQIINISTYAIVESLLI